MEKEFIETLDFLYAKLVEKRIDVLMAKERTTGLELDATEKQELALLLAR